MAYTETLNDCKRVCNFCTIYIVLFARFFIIGISISSALIYFYWHLNKDNTSVNTETLIY